MKKKKSLLIAIVIGIVVLLVFVPIQSKKGYYNGPDVVCPGYSGTNGLASRETFRHSLLLGQKSDYDKAPITVIKTQQDVFNGLCGEVQTHRLYLL